MEFFHLETTWGIGIGVSGGSHRRPMDRGLCGDCDTVEFTGPPSPASPSLALVPVLLTQKPLRAGPGQGLVGEGPRPLGARGLCPAPPPLFSLCPLDPLITFPGAGAGLPDGAWPKLRELGSVPSTEYLSLQIPQLGNSSASWVGNRKKPRLWRGQSGGARAQRSSAGAVGCSGRDLRP